MKIILVNLFIIFFSISIIYAEDESWYEIDGITFRVARKIEATKAYIQDYDLVISAVEGGLTQTYLYPINIELKEKIMNSWSFRGATLEYQDLIETEDLQPRDQYYGSSSYIFGEGWKFIPNHNLQSDSSRKFIYNNIFNEDEKSFADSNPYWALSADMLSSFIFLGYYWGIFIPIDKYNRFLKIGIGPAIGYINYSLKLNLCSMYVHSGGHEELGRCEGKREIDSLSKKDLILNINYIVTLWEQVTENSIWRIGEYKVGNVGFEEFLNNKNKKINIETKVGYFTTVSYTYRF